MAKEPPYTYTIKEVTNVVDGDTIDVIIDLGFSISVKKRVRLYGINTPEVRTRDKEEKVKGLAAKDRLIELCMTDSPHLLIKCHGIGKYGRILGEIWKSNISINRILVKEGHAVDYL